MKTIICHVTSAHPANDIRIFHKECVSLAEQGYEVHLVAKGRLPPDAKGVIHHTLVAPPKGTRVATMIWRSWKAYQLAKSTPATIFHLHDPELLPYGLLLKWQGNIVIYDAHEDLPRDVMMKDWIPRPLRKATAWLVEIIENSIARRLNIVIAATPFICQRFQKIGANATEVKNFPKREELCLPTPIIPAKHQSPAICYVGMISIQRGIIEMIKAIEILDVRLIIAGAFVDTKTEKLVCALPGWVNIDFRATVSREDVATIFAESSLGLCLFHPSTAHNESLPNKLFEYMSAGLPVLSSNFPLWRSIVEETRSGLTVTPENIAEISNAIQWLLENSLVAKEMGRRGKRAVEECYNWELEKVRLMEVYGCFSH